MIFHHRAWAKWLLLVLVGLPGMPLRADNYQDRLEKAVLVLWREAICGGRRRSCSR